MRHIIITFIFFFFAVSLFAQTPQAMNYQAVARNANGTVLPNQNINVRFSILDVSINGTTLYSETHSAQTNAYGLFTLAIGGGTVTSGVFSSINWGNAAKFLKVEIAPDGSSNYTLQSTTQFLSVPYALYAEKTNLAAGTGISITGNTISGTYTGTNGVSVTGSTISGAYTGSNGVTVTGSNITGSYTGTNGVSVTGSTISGAYVGGTGINITGNTISTTVPLNPWTTTGNSGTNPANNFLGTTDNQPLIFKTNNLQRLSIGGSQTLGGRDNSFIDFGKANTPNELTNINVWGTDVTGISFPFILNNDVKNKTWDFNPGANNTLGRFIRFNQGNTILNGGDKHYDIGMDNNAAFYISEYSSPTSFAGRYPYRMITIDSLNHVGINFQTWNKPITANFHTFGTVRFEGITQNNALNNVLVTDANGNLSTRDASTLISPSLWASDAFGIHNQPSNNVGVRTNSGQRVALTVYGNIPGVFEGNAAEFNSSSTWHTDFSLINSTSSQQFTFIVGGSGNTELKPTNFGMYNNLAAKWTMVIGGTNNFVGFGSQAQVTPVPKSTVHVFSGDVNIEQIGSGIIIKSPNGQCWRVTVDNTGALVTTAIACP